MSKSIDIDAYLGSWKRYENRDGFFMYRPTDGHPFFIEHESRQGFEKCLTAVQEWSDINVASSLACFASRLCI